MAFSLGGNSIPEAGIPGEPNCNGETVDALAAQFGGINPAASALGFSSVAALHDSLTQFCNP